MTRAHRGKKKNVTKGGGGLVREECTIDRNTAATITIVTIGAARLNQLQINHLQINATGARAARRSIWRWSAVRALDQGNHSAGCVRSNAHI
jgi:hypothetical protein